MLNSFFKALLQYRNCPSPDTGTSPAQCLFGRAIRDLLPGIPPQFQPQHNLVNQRVRREQAVSKRLTQGRARWDEHTNGLSPLQCGDQVLIQNQTGRHPTKWDKSGTIVEVHQYHKYSVRVDGSGRLTTRNRRYLRKYNPFPAGPDHPHRRELPAVNYHPPSAADAHQPDQPTSSLAKPPVQPTSNQAKPPEPLPVTNLVAEPPSITLPSPPHPMPTASTTPPAQPSPKRPLLATPSDNHPYATTPDTRSYASVAKAPPRINRRSETTPTTLYRIPPFTLPTTPAPEPRRSKRGPKPIDRYGQTSSKTQQP